MNKNDNTIAVSILTADFLNLKSELDRIIVAKIPAVHFDIMDNNFVPNLSFGPKILSDVTNYLKDKNIVVDCHLMVQLKPKDKVKSFLKPFIMPGINSITLHYEALNKKQLLEFANWSNSEFKKGLALKPKTPIKVFFPYLTKLDYLLIMSVEPGFGNQKFIASSYQKIKTLKQYLITKNLSQTPIIAVDGGINNTTGPLCFAAGANYLVSGSYLLNNQTSVTEQLEKLWV
ncbi:MAG: ribulose-phosphate 3-epimerase [Spiroplasma sp.]|nr:ribulose-phosphate 3-epimerase [Spiroplasma sp.]